jgi:hypothetical protein
MISQLDQLQTQLNSVRQNLEQLRARKQESNPSQPQPEQNNTDTTNDSGTVSL